MKRLIALVCVTCAFPAWAADVGVGVSAKSNDSTIYVPIDIDDKLRIEPLLRHAKSKSESYGYETKYETLQLGVGVFALKPLAESVRIYYGARLSYLNIDGESAVAPPYQYIGINADGDGYRVSPTFGFEYLFNKHLSIGGEAEWFYEDVRGGPQDDTRSGTETRLILRLRF